jgi:hypothetical protein
MMNFKKDRKGKGLRLLSRLLTVGALAVPVAACSVDEILEVEDPDFATPIGLESPAGIPILFQGAIGDFATGFIGQGDAAGPPIIEGYVMSSALFTDEWYSTDTFVDRLALDRRELRVPQQGNRSDAAFARLQRTRRQINGAIAAAERVGGNVVTSAQIAELRALQGYVFVLLAEGFCGAIPFSGSGTGEFGTPLTTNQTLDSAVVYFDMALALDAGSNLAKIGRGRALLNLGRFADAAAAVNGVANDYQYLVRQSANSTRTQNQIFGLQNNSRFSQSEAEGINGLLYRTDPRNPESKQEIGFDGTNPLFRSLKYDSFSDPVVLASGVEARLIEAEAALQAGNGDTFIARINDARRTAVLQSRAFTASDSIRQTIVLADATDPGNAAGRRDLLFAERGYNLYLTGTRLGDLRRLIRQYGRTEDDVYPTGVPQQGGAYGNDVNFSIPFAEQNNPLFDPNQCVTTQA